MFGFGLDHTGFSSDTTISKAVIHSSMVLNWTGTTGSQAQSSPAVASGGQRAVYVGSTDNTL
jgi:hypothetical protein